MNNKFSFLSKNIFLFAISSFGPKILSFLLVPLYTNCLSTSDYGIGDLITTTASLLLPIITLCISSATLRFAFDKDFSHEEVFTNSLYITFKGYVFFILAIFVLVSFQIINLPKTYLVSIAILILANGIYDLLTCFARGIDSVGMIVEMSIITTAFSCGLNIVLLLCFNMGLVGYLFANCGGILVSDIWGILRLRAWKFVDLRSLSKPKRKILAKYSIPLIFNKIGWWINSSSDRYIVIGILGSAANGIYTVSYKIPTILTACSDVFAQAWQLSAIREIDSEDSSHFISEMYNSYNAFLVACCSILIILNIPIANFLYAKDFNAAWRFVPPLLISFVFGGLSGFFGSIFVAAKDTKIFTVSTLVGGVINVLLNCVLVSIMNSAMGAALATMISNVAIWLIRYCRSKKYVNLSVSITQHFVMYFILVIQFFALEYKQTFTIIIIEIFLFIVLLFINRNRYFKIMGRLMGFIKKK